MGILHLARTGGRGYLYNSSTCVYSALTAVLQYRLTYDSTGKRCLPVRVR
jgi:hypothetical protein